MRGVETRTRKVKQVYRILSNEKKKEIVTSILNRPTGQSLYSAIEDHGIVSSVFYRWKEDLLKSGDIPSKFKSHPQSGRENPRWSEEEKKEVINTVENLPNGTKKNEALKKLGVPKGQYYTWRKKYGIVKVYNSKADIEPMVRPMTKKVNGKTTHLVTLTVEVGSLLELIGFCNNIVKTPKVKSVLSVE